METTNTLVQLWMEARTRFTHLMETITSEDLEKKLPPSQNSIGFLIRHVGDVELLFAKNVFGAKEINVIAKTVIQHNDSGEWTDLPELKQYVTESFERLKEIVETQNDTDWKTVISTKEFGEKSKVEAFGRIVSHTTYHAGQIALIQKYGSAE